MSVRDAWIKAVLDEELPKIEELQDSIGYRWEIERDDPLLWVKSHPRTGESGGTLRLLRLDLSSYQNEGLIAEFCNPEKREDCGRAWWPSDKDQAFKLTNHATPWICLPGFKTYHSAPGNHGGYRWEEHPISQALISLTDHLQKGDM